MNDKSSNVIAMGILVLFALGVYTILAGNMTLANIFLQLFAN